MAYTASRVADLVVTHHAREQMQVRRVGIDSVEAALMDPAAVTYPSRGQRVVRSGDLALVLDEQGDALVLVTVLLADTEPWDNAKAALVFGKGGLAS